MVDCESKVSTQYLDALKMYKFRDFFGDVYCYDPAMGI